MAKDKSSFVLYCDLIHTVKKLSDEQAGNLFKHILKYVNDENPEPENIITEIAFEPIKQALKRDLRKYEAICERNKNNGSKGGRPNKKPKKPNGLFGNPNKPKKADSDSDSDNEIKIDNKIDVISSLEIIKERIYKAEFESFNLWLNGKGFNIKKMKQQLDYDEFENLIVKFGINSVREVFEKMNNYKPLAEKNLSVYSTATNWLNKEKNNTSQSSFYKPESKESRNVNNIANAVNELLNKSQNESIGSEY